MREIETTGDPAIQESVWSRFPPSFFQCDGETSCQESHPHAHSPKDHQEVRQLSPLPPSLFFVEKVLTFFFDA